MIDEHGERWSMFGMFLFLFVLGLVTLTHVFAIDDLGQVVGGQDLMCKSRTGSGKTLAFAIPIIEALDRQVNMETVYIRGRGRGNTEVRKLANL